MNDDTQLFPYTHDAAYLENLWHSWQQDPTSAPEEWRQLFEHWASSDSQHHVQELSSSRRSVPAAIPANVLQLSKVEALIATYRTFGHLSSHLNPLAPPPVLDDSLKLEAFSLSKKDLDDIFFVPSFAQTPMSLRDILQRLQRIYCRKVGADYQGIDHKQKVAWLQKRLEAQTPEEALSAELKVHILHSLIYAEGLEQFLHKRYLGQKRFSLEGLESLICVLHSLSDQAAQQGVKELCLGMAHRGRLNVLVNVMGKSCEHLFESFECSEYNPFDIDGDVKYHIGFASHMKTYFEHEIYAYLAPNPSHLESVNPVVQGFVKARQRLQDDHKQTAIIPILIHGDAAFVGQGIVAETLNFSLLQGYSCGGTIHIILNNQVGFTTDPSEARSCQYASDMAKFINAPVFHVNADDPEACVWAVGLAFEYRQTFGCDVVLDMVGYRRYGHNEGDEPAFTQPLMYQVIKKHPTVLTQYKNKLLENTLIDDTSIIAAEKRWQDTLQKAYLAVKESKKSLQHAPFPQRFASSLTCKKVSKEALFEIIKTAISSKTIATLKTHITQYPSSFSPHKKILKLLALRQDMLEGKKPVDWATAELLALGSLALDGHFIRLTGQDVRRGTFSSRHGALVDSVTGERYDIFSQLSGLGSVEMINSPLSEQGCLGFEFGYAVADHNALVLWEAQFGDFSNGAQVIVDQFLAAGEAKWQQSASLVMLLPHGYEGQGPEHSNARPERYLQLCGGGNIQVVSCSTPGQHFHVLRRQAKRSFRKCLICMTPKSLLRLPAATSELSSFSRDHFQEVIDDPYVSKAWQHSIEKLIFCTGKIYYEAQALAKDITSIAIIRIEQLYPFPRQHIQSIAQRYTKASCLIWMQEEPKNMGAWSFIRPRLEEIFKDKNLHYIGRRTSGSTAEGSQKAHLAEQKRIIEEALTTRKSSKIASSL